MANQMKQSHQQFTQQEATIQGGQHKLQNTNTKIKSHEKKRIASASRLKEETSMAMRGGSANADTDTQLRACLHTLQASSAQDPALMRCCQTVSTVIESCTSTYKTTQAEATQATTTDKT